MGVIPPWKSWPMMFVEADVRTNLDAMKSDKIDVAVENVEVIITKESSVMV